MGREVTGTVKKQYTKLVAAALAVALAAVMAVTVSYAWMTISASPALTGIQVTIGGGTTILLAPDRTETLEDGTVVHYPGSFSDRLNFTKEQGYDYLNDLAGLTPVSTVDGLTWVLPIYYTRQDTEVRDGSAYAGDQKPIEDFTAEYDLRHANLSSDQKETAREGHYVYLDFWVVSPGPDYDLHLAQGEQDGGSFLVELPDVVKDESGGYTLSRPENAAAASARIGFWINQETPADENLSAYVCSAYDSGRYDRLLGTYPEKNGTMAVNQTSLDKFVIYEPNATLHPENGTDEDYLTTWPLGVLEGNIYTLSLPSERHMVQTKSVLLQQDSREYLLEQALETALAGKEITSTAQAESALYTDFLQGHLANYVERGSFVAYTATLDGYAIAGNGKVGAADLSSNLSTASEDVTLTRLTGNVPQRIRLFVWLEGQDVDCTNEAAGARLALNLELSGSSVK